MTIAVCTFVSSYEAHRHLQIARTQGADPTRSHIQLALAGARDKQSLLGGLRGIAPQES